MGAETLEEPALTALLQATHDTTQAIAERQELLLQRTEQELSVLRVERDLLVRRVALLESAHSELQRNRMQLADALRRLARAEVEIRAARRGLVDRGVGLVARLLRRSLRGQDLIGERGNGVVLVDLVGWPANDLDRTLDQLAAQRDSEGTVMVLLTDSDRFDLFRTRGFVFEYLSGDGADHAERVAELSTVYRVDRVLVAGADGTLRPAGRDHDGGASADVSSSDAA